jgi:GTP-binding protein
MPLFQNANYAASVATPLDPYPASDAEIAFAGRSNAGKSSAINTLVGQRRLAFVSKTPGRTQMINFFGLGEGRYLVDLPGYGFAKVPEKVRSQWDRLLSTYLRHREVLRGLAIVMDIRHAMSDLDLQLIEFFQQTGKPIHVLLTKSDKLSREQARAALNEVRRALHELSPIHSVQLFSSLKTTGLDEAEEVFARWLDMPRKKAGPETTAPRAARRNPGRGNKKPRAKGG